ncbi:MAG: DUF5681 domain-containing protein [Rhizobiaceae bacterium]
MNEKEMPEATSLRHRVGYGNPPLVQRFKKSGNSNGRPKGSKNHKTIIREVMQEMHVVNENGKIVRRSTLELVLYRLRNLALEDKYSTATRKFLRLFEKCQSQARAGGVLAAPAHLQTEEWVAQAERHNALMKKHGVRSLAQAKQMDRKQRESG